MCDTFIMETSFHIDRLLKQRREKEKWNKKQFKSVFEDVNRKKLGFDILGNEEIWNLSENDYF